MSEMQEIDMLVAGLPVSQYLDSARRTQLEEQFTGKHQITPKCSVTVKQVKVIAQPVGGLLDYMNQQDEAGDDGSLQIDDEARVLVIDPGFFSLALVLISNGQLQRQSSGTSLNASSVLLEAGKLIAADHGSSLSLNPWKTPFAKAKPPSC